MIRLLVLCVLSGWVLGPLSAGTREIKAKVLGGWVVDADASVSRFLESKKAADMTSAERDKAVANMRAFMRTADLEFRFKPKQLVVTNKGEMTYHGIQILRAAGEVIVFRSTVKTKSHLPTEFRITFINKDAITIHATDSTDLDLYVWKRLPEKEGTGQKP